MRTSANNGVRVMQLVGENEDEEEWRKMYVFFGIFIIISYIPVLLQQEEDGAVAITFERPA